MRQALIEVTIAAFMGFLTGIFLCFFMAVTYPYVPFVNWIVWLVGGLTSGLFS